MTDSEGMFGYDRSRIATLRRHAAAAADHLDGVASDEPTARDAITTIRAITDTLRHRWQPPLDRILGDTSMTGWDASYTGRRSSPSGYAGGAVTTNAQQVDAMVAVVQRIIDGDREAIRELDRMLQDADPATVTALLQQLGPEQFFGLLLKLAANPNLNDPEGVQARNRIAHTLGEAVPLVEGAAGFTPDELAAVAVDVIVNRSDFSMGEEYLVVALVMGYATPATRLEFVEQATEHEIRTGQSLAFPVSGIGTSGPVQLTDPETAVLAADPVAFALGQIASGRTESIAVLTDPEQRVHLMTREYSPEGLVAMTAVFAASTGSEDIYDPAATVDPGERALVAEIAGHGVELLAGRDDLQPDDYDDVPPEVSHHLARVVAAHQPAFNAASLHEQNPNAGQQPRHTIEIDDPYQAAPGDVTVAYISSDGCEAVVGIAGLTDEGMLVVGAGLDAYHQRVADALVAQGETVALAELPATLDQAADIEAGYTVAIGHAREQAARNRDEAITSWVDFGRNAVRLVEWPAGAVPTLGTVLSIGINELHGLAVDALTTYEAAADGAMPTYAAEAVDNMLYHYLSPMIEAGYLDTELIPAGTTPLTPAEFAALDPATRTEFFDDVETAFVDQPDVNESIAARRNTYRAAQEEIYRQLLEEETVPERPKAS